MFGKAFGALKRVFGRAILGVRRVYAATVVGVRRAYAAMMLAIIRGYYLRLVLPRAKRRLRRVWRGRHRVMPRSAETDKASKDLLASQTSAMERAFWRAPRARVRVQADRELAVGAVDALRRDVKSEWPTQAAAKKAVAALQRDLVARFSASVARHVPVREADLDRYSPAVDAVKTEITVGLDASDLAEVRRERDGVLTANAQRAIDGELASVEAGITEWTRNMVADRVEPYPLQQLFVSKKPGLVPYAGLNEKYVNDDHHLEDQMFFGVDLVVAEDGKLFFGVEPSQNGGLLRKLRRWQGRSREYKPKERYFARTLEELRRGRGAA